MYKNILIATDGSDLADKAVSHGISLAKQLNAVVAIVTVTDLWPALDLAAWEPGGGQSINDYKKGAAESAGKILSAAQLTARETGLVSATVFVADQHPAEGIISTAKTRECDLIIMASHGRRGIKKLLLGSVANEVLARASIPVLIIR